MNGLSAHTLDEWRDIACELAAKSVEQDAEIERLEEENERQKKLIAELSEDLQNHRYGGGTSLVKYRAIQKRALEATKHE
jgi:hypothetical protein